MCFRAEGQRPEEGAEESPEMVHESANVGENDRQADRCSPARHEDSADMGILSALQSGSSYSTEEGRLAGMGAEVPPRRM